MTKTILVKEFIPNAFSTDQADILKTVIGRTLELDPKTTIILDFDGIKRFTTLFFNFSTAFYISALGIEKYKEKIKINNLSTLGKSTYNNSYENAIKQYSPESQQEIINIIENLDND